MNKVNNIINNIVAQLEQLKEERLSIEKDAQKIDKVFRNKVVNLFIEAMTQYGLDELLLLPFSPNGYYMYSLDNQDFDFECDCSNLVDCSFEVLYAGKVSNTSKNKEVPIVTRFGLKDGQLLYHTTSLTMCKDGDLSFDIVSQDNWQQPWKRISEYKSSKKLVELLFTYMSHPGNWEFTKEHPECCFLHRQLEAQILHRIEEYSGRKDLSGLFDNYIGMEEVELTSLDASNATTVQAMFYHCENLRAVDVSSLNTEECKSFESMFDGCTNLETIYFGDFKTGNGKTMQEMFRDCKSLKSIDLSSFDTSQCENMKMMFRGCSLLSDLDLGPLNTANCFDMSMMFYNCNSIKSLNLSSLDTSYCQNMRGLFSRCSSLTSLDLRDFRTDFCSNMEGMFLNCKSLKSLDLSSFNTSECNDMALMFSECSSLISLDLSNFDVKCLYQICGLFEGCENLEELNLSNWELQFPLVMIEEMFTGCHKLSRIYLRNSNENTLNCIRYAIEEAGLKGVEIITT